jgi:hypothetical protein
MRNVLPLKARLVGLGLVSVLLTSAPALAWIPKLDDSTAKNVIDAAYGRRDALPTYLTADLGVQDGKFKSGAVTAFDGGDACVADWLAAPTAYDKSGSRLSSLTLSGQADQLSFQAGAARDSFKNLTAADALKAFNAGFLPNAANEYGTKVVVKSESTATQAGNTSSTTTTTTASVQPQGQIASLPDGQIRLDLVVAGLADLKQRAAYLVRLKGPDGKLLAPVKSSYVNDWKADSGGRFGGTLVYYFEPTKAGVNANDKIDILVRTEAESNCAYAVNFDLGQFY